MKNTGNFLNNLSIKSMGFILVAILLIKHLLKGSLNAPITDPDVLAGTQGGSNASNPLNKPSYSWQFYVDKANYLEKCMVGIGTSNIPDILKIFSYLHTEKDFELLNKCFGVREFPDNLFGLMGPASMKEWLRGDLSDEHCEIINGYLKTSGIKSRI